MPFPPSAPWLAAMIPRGSLMTGPPTDVADLVTLAWASASGPWKDCGITIDCDKVQDEDPKGEKGQDWCQKRGAKDWCLQVCATQYALCYSGDDDIKDSSGSGWDAENQESPL
jgi:hypothetical protein